MTPRAKKAAPRTRGKKVDPYPDNRLVEIGLHTGERVRFRRSTTERWKFATVARREKDGSVGLVDAKGAARSIAIAQIEVEAKGPRGGTTWEPLSERIDRTEQLALVRNDPERDERGRLVPKAPRAPRPATTPTAKRCSSDSTTEQLGLLD